MSRTFADAKVHTPANLEEALDFLANHANEGWKPLAGGTDALVPIYRDGAEPTTPWLNLQKLRPELRFVRRTSNGFEIGALATISDLMANRDLCETYPIVRQCCQHFASPAIRHRATVAGNLANASPASDIAPVLLALEAEIESANHAGRRFVTLDAFWTGYKATVLAPDELIVSVRIPHRDLAANASMFRKVAPRASNSIALLNCAAIGTRDSAGTWTNVRIALGCMGPVPMRARKVESAVEDHRFDDTCREEAKALLQSTLRPITDYRATAEYRMLAATNLVSAFLDRTAGNWHS
ncbi:hypothetical protein GC170_03105 [bacterium]|nr:hypothetical protein [bacterium]